MTENSGGLPGKSLFDGPLARIGLAVFAFIWLVVETVQGNVLWMVVSGVMLGLALADLFLRDKGK